MPVQPSAGDVIKVEQRTAWRVHLLAFAAGASILSASLANFLLHNDYPLIRPEVGILSLAVLALASGMAPLYVRQRHWGQSLLDGLLVLLFADLNNVPLQWSLLAALVAGIFGWWRKIPLSGPLAILGTVVLLMKVAEIGGRKSWFHTERREIETPQAPLRPGFAVLHLLLDEQAGVQGIYPDPEGLRLRAELRDFFLDRGFTLYGRAYSEHMHTVNAVPAVLNFGAALGEKSRAKGVAVGQAAYFDRLNRAGFRIHVLQNDFVELCADNPIASCTTYDSFALRPTLAIPLGTFDRARLITLKLLSVSRLATRLFTMSNEAGRLGWFGHRWPPFEPSNLARTTTTAAVVALESWLPEVRRARPGEVYFAHLLLPHFPHLLRADCSHLPWADWETMRSNTTIEQRRRTYVEQDRCTLRKVDKLIRAFEQSAGGKAGVVIVHGDHGSRILRTPPVLDQVGRFKDEDVIAAHSTLFAVRGRHVQPRYDETPQAITALLRSFVESDFQRAPMPARPMQSFVLADRGTKMHRRADMPKNW